MKYIYDKGTQVRTFDPEAIYSPNTKDVNRELIIYLHSSCQAMLNTAAKIDKVAATSEQKGVGPILIPFGIEIHRRRYRLQFTHVLNLHNDVANLLRFMKIPVEPAGAGGLWKCDPPPMVSLFKEQD